MVTVLPQAIAICEELVELLTHAAAEIAGDTFPDRECSATIPFVGEVIRTKSPDKTSRRLFAVGVLLQQQVKFTASNFASITWNGSGALLVCDEAIGLVMQPKSVHF